MTAARTVLPLSLAVLALCGAAIAVVRPFRVCVPPSDPVLVPLGAVPPDACVALFGPGPCRPHGAAPTTGWTDAVAGPPPEGWRGKVEASGAVVAPTREVRR